MGSIAVLDTNVLLPAPLRDTLLRLAEADLYVPKWSDRILAELTKNLVDDPKDRHVLAAAVGVGAQVVVSHNLDDFPPAACEPLDIEAVSPDDFLVDLFHLDPLAALRAVSDQAAALTKPPLTAHQVLDYIALDAPKFAELIRKSFRDQSRQ